MHDGYRIEPAGGRPKGGWVVYVDEPQHPVIDSIDPARFTSLKAAKAAAIHHRVLATRRIKLVRHIVLAFVLFTIAVPAFAMMGPGTSTRRVAFFVVGLGVLLLALREVVDLLMLVFSTGWDYAYDMPQVSRLDAAVADIATAIVRAPGAVDFDDSGPPRVHIVELEDADQRK
jgi:hypothetical protein